MKILLIAKKGEALTGPGTYRNVLYRELSKNHQVKLFESDADLEVDWDIAHVLDIKHFDEGLFDRLRCPLLVDVHDYYWVRFYPFLSLDLPLRFVFQRYRKARYTRIIKRSAAVLTHCDFVRRQIDHPFKYLLWIGIDIPEEEPAPGKKDNLILFVGRDYFRKGIMTLIRAMPEVLKRHADAKVIVIGKEWGHSRLLARILAWNLPFRFLDAVPNKEVRELYKRAKVFVLPSHIEASPITVTEAMASGVPVVASNVGGIPEMIIDGESGHLFKRGDAGELAEKITACLDADSKAAEIARNGYEAVKKRFDSTKMVFELEKIYHNVILHYKERRRQ